MEKLPQQPKTVEEVLTYLAMETDTNLFKSHFYLNYVNDMDPDAPYDPYNLVVVDKSSLNANRHAIMTRQGSAEARERGGGERGVSVFESE